MLLDDEKKLVELFMDNVIWGNIKINLGNWDTKDTTTVSIVKALGEWISSRRNNESISDDIIGELYSFFTVGRFTDVITGTLRNRDEENKIKELKEDNEKLIGIVAEQKDTIENHIGKATDTKNIRGIE